MVAIYYRAFIRIIRRAIIPVSLIIYALSAAEGAADGRDKLRILTILPLTGEAASVGTAFKNGMVLALEKVPEDIRADLDFLFEDDGLSPKNSVSILNRALVSGRVNAVINLSSSTAKALAPLTESKRIPFLAVASDSSISKGRHYAFNFWVTPDEELQALFPEMKRREDTVVLLESMRLLME